MWARLNLKRIAFAKENSDSIRPIGILCTLDKLVDTHFNVKLTSSLKNLPNQFAVCRAHGTSLMHAAINASVTTNNGAAIFWDVSNAFNSIDRHKIYEALLRNRNIHHLAPWFWARYTNRTRLQVHLHPTATAHDLQDDSLRVDFQTGTIQGSPSSSTLFCIGLQMALDQMNSADPVFQQTSTRAFADDMATVIPAGLSQARLEAMVTKVEQHLGQLGLTINKDKLIMWDPHNQYNAVAQQLNMPRQTQCTLLGGALELDPTSEDSLTYDTLDKAGAKLQRLVTESKKLLRLTDGSSLLHRLARHCFASTCTFHFRTAHYSCTENYALTAEDALKDTIATLVQRPHDQLENWNIILATLPTRFSGLGLHSPVLTRPAAKLGSVSDIYNSTDAFTQHDNQLIQQWLLDNNGEIEQALGDYNDQVHADSHKTLSQVLDCTFKAQNNLTLNMQQYQFDNLVQQAADESRINEARARINPTSMDNQDANTLLAHETQYLNRVMEQQAMAQAVSNQRTGASDIFNLHLEDTPGLDNKTYQTILRNRIGITPGEVTTPQNCAACYNRSQKRHVLTPCHAAGCPSLAGTLANHRHNRATDVLYQHMLAAGYTVLKEQPVVIDDINDMRRTDLSYRHSSSSDPSMRHGDFTTTIIYKTEYSKILRQRNSYISLERVENQKRKKYRDVRNFTPLATTMNGALGKELQQLIKEIAAKRMERTHPDSGHTQLSLQQDMRYQISRAIAFATARSMNQVFELAERGILDDLHWPVLLRV